MAEHQVYLKILPATAILKTDIFKSIDYLNSEFCRYFPSFQKTGIHLCGEVVKIAPSNFPELSFLNLEACCYELKKTMPEIDNVGYFTPSYSESTSETDSESDYELYNDSDSDSPFETCSEPAFKFQSEIYFQNWTLQDAVIKNNIYFSSFFNSYVYRAKKYGHDYYGFIIPNHEFHEFPCCLVLVTFLSGRPERMRSLLKYGVQKIHTSKVIDFCRHGECNPLYLIYFVFETLEAYRLSIRFPETHLETYVMHRTFLVIETIFLLFKAVYCLPGDEIPWVECYRLLWRSIPDPYLSQEEIGNVLHTLAVKDELNMIDEMCKHYKRVFPEMAVITIIPRSLQHACRCVIRNCMRLRYALPEGITHLAIPLSLKSFLNLES